MSGRRSRRGSNELEKAEPPAPEERPAKRARNASPAAAKSDKPAPAEPAAKSEKPAKGRGRRGESPAEEKSADSTVEEASPAKKGSPAKKAPAKKSPAKKVDEVSEKIELVISAIRAEDNGVEGSENSRELLAVAARPALLDGVAGRSSYQTQMIGCIGNALESIAQGRDAKCIGAAAELGESEAAKVAAEQAQTVVASKLEEHKNVLDALQSKAKADKDALDSANKTIAANEKDAKGFEKKRSDIQSDVDKVSKSIDTFNSAIATASDKKTIGVLTTSIKECNVDESLLKAIPSALSQEPAERGAFDNIVVTQIETYLAAHKNELLNKISMADAELQTKATESETLKASTAALQAASDQSSAEATTGKEKLKAIEGEMKEAKSVVKKAADAHTSSEKEVSATQASREEFKTVQAAFTWLADRGKPEAAAPEPAAELEEPVAESEPMAMAMETETPIVAAVLPGQY